MEFQALTNLNILFILIAINFSAILLSCEAVNVLSKGFDTDAAELFDAGNLLLTGSNGTGFWSCMAREKLFDVAGICGENGICLNDAEPNVHSLQVSRQENFNYMKGFGNSANFLRERFSIYTARVNRNLHDKIKNLPHNKFAAVWESRIVLCYFVLSGVLFILQSGQSGSVKSSASTAPEFSDLL